MSKLTRTGLSIERELLLTFDKVIAAKGYKNRSEAIRDLIRDHLVVEAAGKNEVVVGTLTIVYDHHRPNLTEKLVEAQHHAGGQVLAATHVHLDHHNCLEVVIMKGRSGDLAKLANGILSLRGVKHGDRFLPGGRRVRPGTRNDFFRSGPAAGFDIPLETLQVGAKLGGSLTAQVGILFESLAEDVLERYGEARIQFPRGSRSGMQDAVEDHHRG